MGKNLRTLQERQDYTGKLTYKILSGGNLIPYAVSCAVFTDFLIDHIKTGEEHLIIDGFPRTPEQVPALHSAMEFFDRSSITVVYLNISDEEAMKRLLPRKRYDDTDEGIRKRLAWSREQTIPNLNWFREHSPRYRVIEVFGERAIEEVQMEIRQKLGFA
jgi:adenylate kinase